MNLDRQAPLLSVLTAALASLAVLGACTKNDAKSGGASSNQGSATEVTGDTIKIGEVGSLTGPEATFGTSSHQGFEMAANEINKAGGIKGKKIQLIKYDDQGKPDEAATVTNRLVTQDKVVALVGEVASARSLVMAPIAQRYKIPMLTHASTNPRVTQVGDYIFRTCFIDPFQGAVMAHFALDTLKAKKIAVLQDVKNDYSVGLAQYFQETFKKSGGEIVANESYASNDFDFKAQLTAIRGKNPEAIYVPGYYTDVALIARQARELGIKVPLLGGDGWVSDKLFEIGGKAIEGNYISDHYSAEDKSQKVQDFIKNYKAMYNSVPDAMAALAYDAIYVLADAMKRAPQLTTLAIRDALAQTKDLPSVTGKITLDANRNPIKSAIIEKVEDGKFKYVTTVNP